MPHLKAVVKPTELDRGENVARSLCDVSRASDLLYGLWPIGGKGEIGDNIVPPSPPTVPKGRIPCLSQVTKIVRCIGYFINDVDIL